MPAAPSAIWVFIAGMATVLTPCVLPVLPVMLSGSVGNRLRPAAIVAGMSLTFTLMGIFISAAASFTFFTGYLRQLSILFIIGMGLVLFSEYVNRMYVSISSSIVSAGRQYVPFLGNLETTAPREGLLGGLMLGMSLGVVWIPCVGPILGAVLVYVAASTGAGNFLHGITLLLIYSLGVSIPMLVIAYSGKSISNHVSWLAKRSHFFKKLSGLVLILAGLMMFFEIDNYLKTLLFPYSPNIESELLNRYEKYLRLYG